MNRTKIISLRVSEDFYNNLHIHCNDNEITITDWMDDQLKIATNQELVKQKLLVMIRSLRRSRSNYSNHNTDEIIEKLKNYVEENL